MQMMSWMVGEIKITQIIETEAGKVIQEILPDATSENIRKLSWLQPHFADEKGNLKAVVQAFVIEVGQEKILVDACVGNDKPRNDLPAWNKLQTDFLERLTDVAGSLDAITKVFCTHLHFDHIGWNTRWNGEAWVPTFPQAHYLLSKTEFDYWQSKPEKEIEDDRVAFIDSIMPVYEAGLVTFVSNNDEIAPGVSLLPTHGHTPGHVSVLVQSKDEAALITGDTFHHPCQITHPDWENISDTLSDMAKQCRKDLISNYANTPMLIIGSHFSQPTAGHIVSEDNRYRFQPM